MAVANLDEEVRGKLHIDDKVDSGAVVTGIERDSAAARAGLRPGDVVVQLDRKPVKDAAEFRALAAKADDKSSLLLVARKGGTMFVLVKK